MTNPNDPRQDQRAFVLQLAGLTFIYFIYFVGWLIGFANGKLF